VGKPFPWPALVLTAGLATRLQPLSSVRAKAALPVAGDVLVLRILQWLRRSGVTRVVLNLHHRAETITREVGDGSAMGLEARYSWEPEVVGSAGGPARALPLLEADRFLIVNGDTLADVDLTALAAQHVDTNAAVTMAVVDGDPRYNGIIADDAGLVRGFGREPGAFHFIGVQAANASAFAGVSPDTRSETVHGIYPKMIASRPDSLRVMRTNAEFFDIGTPQDYLETARTIANREGRALDRGRNCRVAHDARIDSTILWNDVTVGAGASLSNCVVTDGVTVPAGSSHDRSSLVMTENGMIATPFVNLTNL
jgi:NDP-sugar pyrophosphorylase family protein